MQLREVRSRPMTCLTLPSAPVLEAPLRMRPDPALETLPVETNPVEPQGPITEESEPPESGDPASPVPPDFAPAFVVRGEGDYDFDLDDDDEEDEEDDDEDEDDDEEEDDDDDDEDDFLVDEDDDD
jgi:hypothetical protein